MQELGPWGCEWLQFLVKFRAVKEFYLDRGAWHGCGDALGRALVSLLERGGGRRPSGGTHFGGWGQPSSNTWVRHAYHHALGGLEDPGGRKDLHGGPPLIEVQHIRRNPVASLGWPGRQGAGVQSAQGQYPRPLALVGQDRDQLCPGRRCRTS